MRNQKKGAENRLLYGHSRRKNAPRRTACLMQLIDPITMKNTNDINQIVPQNPKATSVVSKKLSETIIAEEAKVAELARKK